MRYLTVKKFANESGYTQTAIKSNISNGTWVEDGVWKRAPDNRILIDVQGYEDWVVNGGNRARLAPPSLPSGSQEEPELACDKIHERRLAELIGTTPKALEHKRREGIIPQGVWLKEHGRIMYSLARYDEWAERQWVSLIGSSPGAKACEFVSPEAVRAQAKRIPIKQSRKGSQRPVITMLV